MKQKLKVKPKVEKHKPVFIVIEKETEKEKEEPMEEKELQESEPEKKKDLPKEPKIQKLTIIDERDKGFDRETLMKRLTEHQLVKVTMKPVKKALEEQQETRLP